MSGQRGFTLVELIAVIVVLSVIASMGSSFIASTMTSYNQTQYRSKLIQKGRQALERMSRQIRSALPFSVRVTSGACVEFLPIAGGGHYTNIVPDAQNGAPAAGSGGIATNAYSILFGVGKYMAIAPMASSEIYSGGESLAAIVDPGTGGVSVTLSANKQWMRNSVNQRFYLSDDVESFCWDSALKNLNHHSGYTLVGAQPEPPGAGQNAILVDKVNALVFSLENGTEARNAVLNIQMTIEEGGETFSLNHEVHIRNVP